MPAASKSRLLQSSDGVKIYADAVGAPSNPSIVFIHGFMLSAIVFDNIFKDEQYASRLYMVRYDLRGHGRSGKPNTVEDYSSRLFADDFAAVATEFNLSKPVVVGWSLGTTVIADIAAHLPEDMLGGAVYLGGGPSTQEFQRIGTPYILERILAVLSPPEDLTKLFRELEMFSDSMFHNVEEIPWETRALWRGMSTFQSPAHRRFVLSRQQDSSMLFKRGAKGLPLLVVLGEHDLFVETDELRNLLHHHFTNSNIKIIEGSGHAVHFQKTGRTMGHIIEFANRNHKKSSNNTVRELKRRASRYIPFNM